MELMDCYFSRILLVLPVLFTFVCASVCPSEISQSSTLSPSPMSGPWVSSNNSCYAVSWGLYTHFECADYCINASSPWNLTAGLASFQDRSQSKTLASLLRTFSDFALSPIEGNEELYWWIGGYKVGHSRWKWSDGGDLNLSNFDFEKNEPNNHCGFEKCIATSVRGRWLDIDCRVKTRCVCEINTTATIDYIQSVASREPLGRPYALGGPHRTCPRSEDSNYGIILVCAVGLSVCLYIISFCTLTIKYFDISMRSKGWSSLTPKEENGGSGSASLQCPSLAKEGSIIDIKDREGEGTRQVIVPPGVKPGDFFIFEEDLGSDIELSNDTSQPVTCCRFPSDSVAAEALLLPSKKIATEAFDCIRGMGALQVSIGHFFNYYVENGNSPSPEFGGGNAVLMFFVMSGFLMMIGYAGKSRVMSSKCCWADWRIDLNFSSSFLQNRIARLCPVAWTSIMFCIPLSILSVLYNTNIRGIGERNTSILQMIYQYLATFLFVQSWHRWLLGPNGPLWSICE